MTDITKAIAAARKALARLREHNGGTRYNGDDDDAGERACCLVASWKPHDSDCPHAAAVAEFDRLLAAIDAAQPVAWALTMPDGVCLIHTTEEASRRAESRWPEAYDGCQHVPFYAAPPAQPLVERYGDGVLVHWPEGVRAYMNGRDNIHPCPRGCPAKGATYNDLQMQIWELEADAKQAHMMTWAILRSAAGESWLTVPHHVSVSVTDECVIERHEDHDGPQFRASRV